MSTARQQVYSVLEHVAQSLDGIDGPVLRAVLPVLHQAHAEIQADLRHWITRQKGRDTFTAQRHRNVLLHLRASLDKLESAGVEMEGALKHSYATVGPLAIHNIKRQWKEMSHIFEGTAQPIALDEAVLLADGKKLLWPKFKSSSKKYAGDIGERAKRELAVSRARSETIDELTNRLQRKLPDVFRADRSGAERLARTETMNAYGVTADSAIQEMHKEDTAILSRWDASPDFRRCPMCASLDGQIIDKSKGEKFVARWWTKSKRGMRQHVRVIEGEIAHPNCRCVQCAWRASWAAYSRNKQQIDERMAA